MALSDISYYQGVYGNLHTTAVIIGGAFVLVALVLSILLILEHLRSYTNPEEQKWIIGILFMVPVYASESLISLLIPKVSIVCDILRNCYEAFALYSFGSYLVACLGGSFFAALGNMLLMSPFNSSSTLVGGEHRVIELLEDESRKQLSEPLLQDEGNKGAVQRSSFIHFFLWPSVLGKAVYTIEKFGLVQYMILKMVCAFLALLLELLGVYGDGEFKWYYGYPYITVVLNFSQMWALYCLVQFYNVTHHRLQPIRPLAKFISFKAIVFATWWQGVGIAILCALGVLPKEGKFQNGLQNFLICIEMAIAAVAHVFVFSANPYQFVPVSEHGKVTTEATKATLKIEGSEEKPAAIKWKEACIEAPGTSITESVQDVVLGGGEHVVKDVVLTITQAMEPVEKGVTKIQETFHHMSLGSNHKEEVEIDEHLKEDVTESGPNVVSSEKKVMKGR